MRMAKARQRCQLSRSDAHKVAYGDWRYSSRWILHRRANTVQMSEPFEDEFTRRVKRKPDYRLWLRSRLDTATAQVCGTVMAYALSTNQIAI
jgi:hypothetical protein